MHMRGSVKQKLLTMISALILTSVLAVTALTYHNDRSALVLQSTQATQQLLEQLSINVDTYLDELFRLCLSPYYNRQVMEQLELSPVTAAEKLQKQRVIEDYLTEVMTLPRGDILRAHIVSDGVYSSSKTRYGADLSSADEDADWYRKAVVSRTAVFLPAHVEAQGKTLLSVFGIAQRINSTRDSGKVLGVIRVDANYNGIQAVCDRAGTSAGSALMILDSADNEIYRSDRTEEKALQAPLLDALSEHKKDESFSLRIGRSEYLVSVQTLHAADWRIVDVRSMRVLTAAATKARDKAFLLALLCAVLGMLVSVPLVRR
ncbi:MAG: hypothetical protein EOM69_10340, partial [Clostridia bacterium]|nr:hypothetical protein [Clostridia bacterium]